MSLGEGIAALAVAPPALRAGAALAPGGAAWRAAAAVAWLLGVAWQLQQARAWPMSHAAGVLVAALVAAGALVIVRVVAREVVRAKAQRVDQPVDRDLMAWGVRLALCLCIATAAFALSSVRAAARLAGTLPPALEDEDLEVTGRIVEMPQWRDDGAHFVFEVEGGTAAIVDDATSPARRRARVAVAAAAAAASGAGPGGSVEPPAALADPPQVPTRLWLFWGRPSHDDRTVSAGPPALEPGQRWRLPVRLRRPHGALNPDGFDAELWLFEQDLRATGSVRGPGRRLGQSGAWLERARQVVRDRILLHGDDPSAAGVLAALAVGDQAAIPSWDVFRDTGVAHLMSISGLHITMLAWLGGAAAAALWRRSARASHLVPSLMAGRVAGVGVAFVYALLAGWGVPAQRTVVMLAAAAALRLAGLGWPPLLVALASAVPVTALDPWSLLQPGFWLSFAAVGMLMVSEPARRTRAAEGGDDGDEADHEGHDATPRRPPWPRRVGAALRREAASGLRSQLVATFGLLPLTLVAFRQASAVGLIANLVAVPWVTLVVTPLALLGVACPPLWSLAAAALHPLQAFLDALARLPGASWHVAAAPWWIMAAALAGGVVAMGPVPRRLRALAALLVLPLCAPPVPRPAPGRFELVAVDVGQGTAVIVRTREHLLLFDTGPQFTADSDAGQRIVLPLLQARGERRIDRLVLSHRDADHVGGAAAILARLPVEATSSSLEPANPLVRASLRAGAPHTRCEAGQRWSWDGVGFEILHPFASSYAVPGAKPNALSCVLRVVDAGGHGALLTGDIEAPQEAALVELLGAALRTDVLVVPHHGSRTSSTAAFLDAVAPRVAVIQAGYRNRYGHPHPDVLARFEARGISVVRTDTCGAWIEGNGRADCTRMVRGRYWNGDAPAGRGVWPGSDVANGAP
jgi:competence protein ComEC